MDNIQKSRVKWVLDGDENTSFFHGIVNSNIASNRVNGLMIDGQWITEPTTIKAHFVAHFRDRFSYVPWDKPVFSVPGICKLSNDQAADLVVPFTYAEVKLAVWQCDGNKSPGPDGFNFYFIKRYWNLLQSDFIGLLSYFHEHGTLNSGCFSAFIALIPKINDPQSPNDSRLVSLIGVLNKVISKILQNRLNMVISGLISEEQSAYVAGRSILDGPLIINETVSWLKK